jgi:hypothetical protein
VGVLLVLQIIIEPLCNLIGLFVCFNCIILIIKNVVFGGGVDIYKRRIMYIMYSFVFQRRAFYPKLYII